MVTVAPKGVLTPNSFVPNFFVQQELYDNAAGDRNQNIIATCLNPMITAGRRQQAVAAPVVDHILPAAFIGGKAVAPVVCMVRTGAALILLPGVVHEILTFRGIQLEQFVIANLLLNDKLRLFIAAVSVSVFIALGNGNSSRGQGH
jgi:hypothetical protein